MAFNDELVTSQSGQGFLYELQIGFQGNEKYLKSKSNLLLMYARTV